MFLSEKLSQGIVKCVVSEAVFNPNCEVVNSLANPLHKQTNETLISFNSLTTTVIVFLFINLVRAFNKYTLQHPLYNYALRE